MEHCFDTDNITFVYKSSRMSTSHFIIPSYVNLCILWDVLPINNGYTSTCTVAYNDNSVIDTASIPTKGLLFSLAIGASGNTLLRFSGSILNSIYIRCKIFPFHPHHHIPHAFNIANVRDHQ